MLYILGLNGQQVLQNTHKLRLGLKISAMPFDITRFTSELERCMCIDVNRYGSAPDDLFGIDGNCDSNFQICKP